MVFYGTNQKIFYFISMPISYKKDDHQNMPKLSQQPIMNVITLGLDIKLVNIVRLDVWISSQFGKTQKLVTITNIKNQKSLTLRRKSVSVMILAPPSSGNRNIFQIQYLSDRQHQQYVTLYVSLYTAFFRLRTKRNN